MCAGTHINILPVILTLILVTSSWAFAEKIYVDDDGPADFNNIQAAIDDSNDGDIIIVAEGRYFESINFNGRNITLTSTDPCNPDVVAATIIDGSQNGSVVTFNSGEDANCVLNGFTITNGNAERGGGMLNFNSTPTITNCIFSGNSAIGSGMWVGMGGGMCNIEGSPTLTNCVFTANSAIGEWGIGGGMYNMEGSPTLTNCTFSENSADYGGGMYNMESSPTLTKCTFRDNSALSRSGGGMYNSRSNSTLTNCTFSGNFAVGSEKWGSEGGGIFNFDSNVTLTSCTFSGNSAGYGGGMCNRVMRNVECYQMLTNCTFQSNSAGSGGGMSNSGNPTSGRQSTPILNNCTFNGNSADCGGGMFNGNSSPTLTNCIFTNNSAVGSGMWWVGGGGMFNIKSSPTIINCTLKENSAESGGGMYNISHRGDSRPTLTDCIFSENSAIYGGGMCNDSSSPTVANCTFSGNSAVLGGGMYNYISSPIVTNCTFSTNFAEFHEGLIIYPNVYGSGGGMYNYESRPTLTYCIICNNIAERRGGGMHNNRSNPMLSNCILSGNWTDGSGGGIYNHDISRPILTNCTVIGNRGHAAGGVRSIDDSRVLLRNCILWANTAYDLNYQIIGPADVNYTDVQDGYSGTGNIDSVPCFVELGYWNDNGTPYDPRDDVWIEGDYHLLPDSPCINAGDPNYIAEPNETDLDGKPRVINSRIDMGAYESPIFAEARILPRTINLASKGKWITCYIWLPEGYNVADIEPNSVLLERQIKAEQLVVNEQEQVAIARFDREGVQPILEVGDINLKITGRLTDGTVFEGTDTIKVLNKAGSKSAKQQ